MSSRKIELTSKGRGCSRQNENKKWCPAQASQSKASSALSRWAVWVSSGDTAVISQHTSQRKPAVPLPLHSATVLSVTRQRTIKNAKPWHGTKSRTRLLWWAGISQWKRLSPVAGDLQSECCVNKSHNPVVGIAGFLWERWGGEGLPSYPDKYWRKVEVVRNGWRNLWDFHSLSLIDLKTQRKKTFSRWCL